MVRFSNNTVLFGGSLLLYGHGFLGGMSLVLKMLGLDVLLKGRGRLEGLSAVMAAGCVP